MRMGDKVAIVTGASGGLGAEIAKAFSREGALVVALAGRNVEAAEKVAGEITASGNRAVAGSIDVSSPSSVDRVIEGIHKEFGRIDILINNAGITKDNLLIRMNEEDWDAVLDVNLKGVFLCTKAVARAMMKKRYGKIINISSIVGINGNLGQGNYSASKAGVIGFTKSMAKELASRGIRVNAIAPGFIETDMTDVLKEEIKDEMIKNIPLKGFGKPHDIANLVVFLAGNKSDYITGEVIRVDGGMAI